MPLTENMQHEPCGNFGNYVSRSYCSVLHNMREIIKTVCADENIGGDASMWTPINVFIILMSLIEELQVYGSRMEAHLQDKKAFEAMKIEANKLKEEIRKLKAEKEVLAPGSTECLY